VEYAGEPDFPSRDFTDIDTSLWYHNAIDFVLNNGIMHGMGDKLFAPDAALSRAMMVQILYNMEGRPSYNVQNNFTDIDGHWSADAVLWAGENNIVEGYEDGSFRPETDLSREQMAAVLCRYARYKGVDTSTQGDLNVFVDGSLTSDWAAESMRWAVAVGIVNGTGDGMLSPLGSATRAHVAQIMTNYCKNILR